MLSELVIVSLQIGLSFVVITALVHGIVLVISLGPEFLQQQDISGGIIRGELESHVWLIRFLSTLIWLPVLVLLLGRRFSRSRPGRSLPARLDLSRPTWPNIAAGIVAALVLGQLVGAVAALLDWLGLADISQRQAVFDLIPGGGWDLLWAFLMIGLLVPLAEELVFRRWLYRSLVDLTGAGVALPLAALAFGLVHYDSLATVLLLTMVGAGLILVYRWSGNLWTSIAAHMTINILAVSLFSLGYAG